MITVFIEGLEFYGYHGVSPEERTVGHRFRLDLEVELDAQAVYSDRIEDTVDYAAMAGRMQEVASEASYLTLERLATALLDRLFRDFPPVVSTRLRLSKLLPPGAFIAEAVGVEISRDRNDSRRT